MSQFAQAARRVDPDRFLMALFVPAPRREAAFTLIAFNDALVRAVEQPGARSGSGPIAALIRLQWWREVIADERGDWRGDALAAAVRTLIETGRVEVAMLAGMVSAREAEAEGIETLSDWRTALRDGPGGLQRALGAVLEVPADLSDRLAAVGCAYACAALRRNLPSVLRSGRCPVPDEMLAASGTGRDAVLQDPDPSRLASLAEALARDGQGFVAEAGRLRLPRHRIAAALPLPLARRDLRRGMLPAPLARGLGDRLAVLAAFVAGISG